MPLTVILNDYGNFGDCEKLLQSVEDIDTIVAEAMEFARDLGAGPAELRAIGVFFQMLGLSVTSAVCEYVTRMQLDMKKADRASK